MMIRTVISVILVLLTGSSCSGAKTMERVVIGKDAKLFALATSGKPFVIRGLNYDRDYKMRLIEEYWETEWPTVEEDFAEMKALGANVVRVHLQFGRFVLAPGKVNEKALERLERLVELAEKTGLYLDLTGLGCYRRSDVPDWYDRLPEKQRWQAQAAFWEAVAKRCAGHPCVFCYDLMNEPMTPSGSVQPGIWLAGHLAGFWYIQYISLDQRDRPRPEIARDWIRTMTGAIRRHDRETLITVGCVDWSPDRPGSLSGFTPEAVAPELDFCCAHLYPVSREIPKWLATLKGIRTGKPLVIEETFPIHCSIQELREFLTKSEPHSAGWIGFYWGKTLDEYRRSTTLADAIMASWLEMFQEMAGPGSSHNSN